MLVPDIIGWRTSVLYNAPEMGLEQVSEVVLNWKTANLLIRIWMIAITFITATKKGFSAFELKKQLGMRCNESVSRMYHELRTVMG